jgi:DNA processing protein
MSSSPSVAHWLALARAPGVGPKTFFSLLDRWHDPRAIFSLSRSTWAELGLSAATINALQHPDWAQIETELAWAKLPGQHILLFSDPAYPRLLKEIAAPPPVLFAKGDIGLLTSPQIGLVGSRNPTPGGRENAYYFAKELAASGLTITSGLALGIDGASHQGALDAQGKTIAVLGTGLEKIYPAKHTELARQIEQTGLLLSEFPLFTAPRPENFPRRNRIISGQSLGILVVEATVKSGSLITARYALEQGREVFAIPGSIHNPLARGCHWLIRQGAKLVETLDDITEELSVNLNPVAVPRETTTAHSSVTDPLHQDVLRCIGYEPTAINDIIRRSGYGADIITSTLLVLELQGHIIATTRGYTLVRRP